MTLHTTVPVPTRQERTMILSGLVVALAGIANIAFGDRDSTLFLGGALLFTGSTLVLPILSASAVVRRLQAGSDGA